VVVFHINSRPSQHQPASVHATHLSCLRGHQALPVVCGKQTGSRLYPRRVTRRHNLVQLDSFFPVRWLHLCACVFSSSSFLPLSFYSSFDQRRAPCCKRHPCSFQSLSLEG